MFKNGQFVVTEEGTGVVVTTGEDNISKYVLVDLDRGDRVIIYDDAVWSCDE